MKQKNDMIKKASAFMGMAGLTAKNTISSLAAEVDLGWMTGEDADIDTDKFDSATTLFKELFASGYGLAIVIVYALAVFMLIFTGLKFMQGGRKIDEAKDQLVFIVVGMIIAFCAITFVSVIANFKV